MIGTSQQFFCLYGFTRAYLGILCFEKQCPKQNTVAHLKSKFLAPLETMGKLCHCKTLERLQLFYLNTKTLVARVGVFWL